MTTRNDAAFDATMETLAEALAKAKEEQMRRMVDRFLSWRLPEDFCPDAGISFKATYNEGTPYERKHEPIGTNLFSAEQARKMIEHILGED